MPATDSQAGIPQKRGRRRAIWIFAAIAVFLVPAVKGPVIDFIHGFQRGFGDVWDRRALNDELAGLRKSGYASLQEHCEQGICLRIPPGWTVQRDAAQGAGQDGGSFQVVPANKQVLLAVNWWPLGPTDPTELAALAPLVTQGMVGGLGGRVESAAAASQRTTTGMPVQVASVAVAHPAAEPGEPDLHLQVRVGVAIAGTKVGTLMLVARDDAQFADALYQAALASWKF